MCASFKHLISILCHEHTLTLPRNNDKLELHTDASTMGIGAVLSVIREDMEKPVAYYSKGLSAAEKNYTVSELECLAVVKAIDHFAIHLLGHFFTVVTDHRTLVALRSLRHPLTGAFLYCGDRPPCPGSPPRLELTEWTSHEMGAGTPSIRLCPEVQTWHTSSKRRWFIQTVLAGG